MYIRYLCLLDFMQSVANASSGSEKAALERLWTAEVLPWQEAKAY